MRRLVIFLLALAALSGSLVAFFATVQERDLMLRGYVDPTRDANLPYRIPILGINVDFTQYPADELPHQLELMQQAHMIWVRQFARWDEIEPEPGQFDWSLWDSIVAEVDATAQVQLVPVLMNAPAWSHPETSSGDPTAP